MNKSSFGSHFTVTTWGESHGKALGAVIDGCPAGDVYKRQLLIRPVAVIV